jgi:hypothetical protein
MESLSFPRSLALSIQNMKVEVVTESLTNLEIAKRQLDRSISLFFNEKDFVSSLTLAGAAEEILGKLLNKQGVPHVMDEIIKGSLALNDIEPGSPAEPKAKKSIAGMMNRFKNKLKHYNEDESITFSVDFYAAEMIDRAAQNYFTLTADETILMKRFKVEVMMGREGNA